LECTIDVTDILIIVYGVSRGFDGLLRSLRCSNFPFDKQDLTIELRQDSTRSCSRFDLCVHAVLFHRAALEQAEWEACEPIVERLSPKPTVTQVKLQVARKPQYYINNVVYIMLGITILSLSTFVLEPDDIGGRLGNTFTLLLTSVAFKFVIGDALPKVTYSTEMDSFLIINMMFLFLMAVFVCIITIIDRFQEASIGGQKPNYQQQAVWALFAFIVLVVINGSWVFRVRKLNSTKRTPAVELIKGKTWYRCDYGNPYFMTAPTEEAGNKKPNVTATGLIVPNKGAAFLKATGIDLVRSV